MKLSEKEKAARKAAFRAMGPGEKLGYIWDYYKWPILLGLVLLLVLGSVLHRNLTKKEPVVYLALANVALGEDLQRELTEGYLLHAGLDGRRQEVYLYLDLYLSDEADTLNHEYAYASKMKLMGAVSAQKLDLVLMNREAWDLLSRGGYLRELSGLPAALVPCLRENQVILSDNSIEYQLGEAETLQIETVTVINAVEINEFPLFSPAGFSEPVYLGLLANSPRPEASLDYLGYLLGEEE